jgi:hypothetical protein
LAVALQQDNTQMHVSDKVKQSKRTTNQHIKDEGHIEANEYNVEEGKIKMSLL